MKKILLISLLACWFFQTSAQNDTFVVFQTKYQTIQILYIGIENPIDILVNAVNPDNIKLSCYSEANNRKIYHRITGKLGNYSVFLNDSITLKGFENSQAHFSIDYPGKNKYLQSFIFEIKSLPTPTVNIEGFSGSEIRAELFKHLNFTLTASSKINSYEIPIEVVKFNLICIPKKGNSQLFEINGNNFSEKMKYIFDNNFKGSEIGSIILFSNIYVKDGINILKLPTSFVITLK